MGWPKGKPRPKETRAKMSAARKAAWADPAVRAKMSAARKAAWADPAVRAKMSAASKAALADPAVRAKMSAAQKRRQNRCCMHCTSRNTYGLIPVEGLDHEFECRDEKACEKRMLAKFPELRAALQQRTVAA
jgi:hypothetical protein